MDQRVRQVCRQCDGQSKVATRVVSLCSQAVAVWIQQGAEPAMNQFNGGATKEA